MRMKTLGLGLSLLLLAGCSSVTTQSADQKPDAPATGEAGTPTPGIALDDDVALQVVLDVAHVLLEDHSRKNPPHKDAFLLLVVSCSAAIKDSTTGKQKVLLAKATSTARDKNAEYYVRIFAIVALGLLGDVGGREAAAELMLTFDTQPVWNSDDSQLLLASAIAAGFPDVPDHTDRQEAESFFKELLTGRGNNAVKVSAGTTKDDFLSLIGSRFFLLPQARTKLRPITHPMIRELAIRLSKERKSRLVGVMLMSVLEKDYALRSEAWALLEGEEELYGKERSLLLKIVLPDVANGNRDQLERVAQQLATGTNKYTLVKLVEALPEGNRPWAASILYMRAKDPSANPETRAASLAAVLRSRVPGSVEMASEFLGDPSPAVMNNLMMEASKVLTEEQLLAFARQALAGRKASDPATRTIIHILEYQGGHKAQRVVAELLRTHPDSAIQALIRKDRGY